MLHPLTPSDEPVCTAEDDAPDEESFGAGVVRVGIAVVDVGMGMRIGGGDVVGAMMVVELILVWV